MALPGHEKRHICTKISRLIGYIPLWPHKNLDDQRHITQSNISFVVISPIFILLPLDLFSDSRTAHGFGIRQVTLNPTKTLFY